MAVLGATQVGVQGTLQFVHRRQEGGAHLVGSASSAGGADGRTGSARWPWGRPTVRKCSAGDNPLAATSG